MEKPGNKQDEESEEDWKLLFELYEILKKRVDAREEKMRDYVRKVGLTDVSYRITCNNGNQRTLINP